MSDDSNPSFEPFSIVPPEVLSSAVQILRNGGVIAFPTDTVYGLGSDIYNEDAVRRIFSIKARPLVLPLPVLISHVTQVESLVDQISPFAWSLMRKFWPGGLTIIFNKSSTFNSLILAGHTKVGIRMPDHPIPLWLVSELGRPIIGTSANLHHREITLTAEEVREQLGTSLDFIVDGGKCPGSIESTIVDITYEPPRILRQGIISEKVIMDLL